MPSCQCSCSPPIFKLDNGIMWHIFSLNADMEQESEQKIPALLTLWYTSQVCHNWRELVLGSPSLWGRVLNSSLLSQEGEEWRREVIHRTGTAPLHFKAIHTNYEWTSELGFLEWILDEHWSRIESLELRYPPLSPPLENLSGHLLGRPAPALRLFKFSWTSSSEYLTSPNFVLFANEALSLRVLYVANMVVNMTTIQVPNLRDLTLQVPIPIPDLLAGLSRMLLLESLQVVGVLPSTEAQILPHVHLSHLTSVKLGLNTAPDVSNTLYFLDRINPCNGCTLEFRLATESRTPSTIQVVQANSGAVVIPAFKTIYIGDRSSISDTVRSSFIADFLDSINTLGIPADTSTLTLRILLGMMEITLLRQFHDLKIQATTNGITFEDY